MPRNAATKTTTRAPAKAPLKAAAKKAPAKRAAPRKTASAAKDALLLLKEDHAKVKKMFDQFEKLKKKDDKVAEMQKLVETACAELTIHAQVEEEIFYPAARAALKEGDLLDEAEVEHASAKQLITELAAMRPGDDLYKAKFSVLGEYVQHHVEEEEKEMFPKVKRAKLDLAGLAEQIQQRKQELREELGLDRGAAGMDDDMADKPARRNLH
ncbi:Hemerythrin HHE cation binding domain-containing protein [Noviherbaspirillum humi]|uniref:Hemerythrin HHE cation binding domain-containing protein n=1 Tax=Noviherbaspirillum humi TaxID=1688639 RepID=A0A239DV92_9BURK|nr:hemerythrin domain-containing protein [Noviherbaspirillum humi]SNS35524.1 Hemerythrin HHE cation binding domain-containing protein [Noviherbaspirillum humi]